MKKHRWLWAILPALFVIWICKPGKIERVSPDGKWTARVTYTSMWTMLVNDWQVVVWVRNNKTGQNSNRFNYPRSLIGPNPLNLIWKTDSSSFAYIYGEDIAYATIKVYDVSQSLTLKEGKHTLWLKKQLPAQIEKSSGEERRQLVHLLDRGPWY